MNEVHLEGRICQDVELKTLGTGEKSVDNLRLRLAINGRPYKDSNGNKLQDTDFVDVDIWDTGAKMVAKYFQKGDAIIVHGSLKRDTWKDKETGKNRSELRVRCNRWEFPLSNKRRDGEDEPNANTDSVVDEQPAEVTSGSVQF